MEKIPIKIIQVTSPGGDTKKGAILDSQYYFQMKEDSRSRLKEFEKMYFKKVEEAQKLFFVNKLNKVKKRQDLSSSVYWELGNMFVKFNDEIKNQFSITNYAEALERDFGLSSRYVRELMIFSQLFKKSEILDSIPMAIYRALVWKKNQLEELGLLEKEKKRLLKLGKTGKFIGRENYKKELIKIVENNVRGKRK